jgi:hypothetical protein
MDVFYYRVAGSRPLPNLSRTCREPAGVPRPGRLAPVLGGESGFADDVPAPARQTRTPEKHAPNPTPHHQLNNLKGGECTG